MKPLNESRNPKYIECPHSVASPELSQVIQALMTAEGRISALTLADVRALLQNGGTTWLRDGELLFPQDCTALVIEVDKLIDSYGAETRALDLNASQQKKCQCGAGIVART